MNTGKTGDFTSFFEVKLGFTDRAVSYKPILTYHNPPPAKFAQST
jgi:hypothetical protein